MDIQPIEFIVTENSEPIRLKDEAEANYTGRRIMEVRVDGAQKYQQITNLYLSGNKLTEFCLEFFNFLPNLQMLDLSNNKITNITNGKQQNQNIQKDLYINLSKNKLTYFPIDLVRIIINEVDLSKNEISEIIFPKNWISSINKLNLSFNKLENFVLQNGTFESIEVLKLNNNELTEIDIKNLLCLKKLYLERNELKFCYLENLNSLEELYISYNQIESVNNIFISSSLKYIYLNNNRLKEIDFKFIYSFPKLKFVHFGSNEIKKLFMSENLNQIRESDMEINLSYNEIVHFEYKIFNPNLKINLINFCFNMLNPFSIKIFGKDLLEKINLKHNLNEERIDLLKKLFEHNKICVEPTNNNSEEIKELENVFENLFENPIQFKDTFPNIKYYFLRQHGFMYYFIFYFFISNSKLDMNNSEKMIKKCDELTKKFEKSQISLLDFLIEIKMDTKILLNLEKKIKKSTNNETLYVEFNFFSAKSIENLCERNDSEIFDLFFPDKILKQNDSKLPYLINKEKFLSEINFERCFRIALENKNEEIATKLLLLYNLFRKMNNNKHGDYFSQDFIFNFLSLIKFFSESNSNRNLDTKPISDLADDFWSPWKKNIYLGFVFIYFVMLIILSWKILKKNSLNEEFFFKYENYLIIFISLTDILKFLFAFIMSIVYLVIKLPIFIKNITRCFYSKRNKQEPVKRNENKSRIDDQTGNNIRFKDSKHFYSFKLFFELINSILLILAVLIYPKLISISIIFVFGVFIFKLDKCPWIGKYVRVLSQIIMKSIPFLIIFVVFLFGFWISFHTLLIPSEFQNINGTKYSEKTENIIEKIIRFVIMGAGNLESDNFPIPDHNQVEIFTILFVYLTFIFSIPVIVINLFGGVSNYEIKNMFDKAEFDDAIEKIQYSINLDKMKEKIKLWINFINCFKISNLMKLPPNPKSENRKIEENSDKKELVPLVVKTIHE